MEKGPVAGDETTGYFTPPHVGPSDFDRLDPDLLERLRQVSGLTPTASDVLEELGLASGIGVDVLQPRVAGGRVVGQAITLRYLPERRALATASLGSDATSRLAHHTALPMCRRGDVLVIDAGGLPVSTFGGMAALEARRHEISGLVVDGGVRDVDQIAELGLGVWSRSITPLTGKFRLEAAQINAPICCGARQVIAGDLVLADSSGVCFVPLDVAEQAIESILTVASSELEQVRAASEEDTGP